MPLLETADRLRRGVANFPQQTREEALAKLQAGLQGAIEGGAGLSEIRFELPNGAVVSIIPAPHHDDQASEQAVLEEARALLQYVFDSA